MTPVGYALWAVLRRDPSRSSPVNRSAESVTEIDELSEELSSNGVTIRGFYDVSAFRADADLMIWIHGDAAEKLQDAYRRLRRTELLRQLLPTWNAMGVHRDAEFSANHVPAFLRGVDPAGWLTVYPFVRSYEWYLLPEDERRAMLGEHGRKGSEYRSVITNTVSAFALGDYEWILPLEANELTDLVDLMRHLRDTDARRHVREEIPFYTGRRITPAEILDVIA
jgi:chlorite dismutase